MAEGQSRRARVGGTGAGKETGRLGESLLMHPEQSGHVEQGRVGMSKMGRKQPVGARQVAGLQGGAGGGQNLPYIFFFLDGDHGPTL
jgi:hypothetical protein